MAAGTQGSHVAHSNQMKFVYDFFSIQFNHLPENLLKNRGKIEETGGSAKISRPLCKIVTPILKLSISLRGELGIF